MDLRGHGFSDKPPRGYALEDHVADILQLLVALDLRRPIILGHSAGGTIAAFVAGRAEIAGLILLEAMIGDRAFTDNAVAQGRPLAEGIDRRYRSQEHYLAESRARRAPWSDAAERLSDRLAHYTLAPLSDGTYRQRALRLAVEAEWASIVEADSLAALGQVFCPILLVQTLQPWWGNRPYFTDAIIAAQRRAAPAADLFVAARSNHSTMIRDPEPAMIEALRDFARHCGGRRRARAATA